MASPPPPPPSSKLGTEILRGHLKAGPMSRIVRLLMSHEESKGKSKAQASCIDAMGRCTFSSPSICLVRAPSSHSPKGICSDIVERREDGSWELALSIRAQGQWGALGPPVHSMQAISHPKILPTFSSQEPVMFFEPMSFVFDQITKDFIEATVEDKLVKRRRKALLIRCPWMISSLHPA